MGSDPNSIKSERNFFMKVVIPCAGKGTRMAFITHGQSKEMFPIAGRPIISYVLEELQTSGIRDIGIIIRKDKEELRSYAIKHFPALRFSFFYQEKPKGVADAILLTRKFIGNHPFGILMPDWVFIAKIPAFLQLKKVYSKRHSFLSGLIYVNNRMAKGFGNCGRIEGMPLTSGFWKIKNISDKKPGCFDMGKATKVLRGSAHAIAHPHFFNLIEKEKENIHTGEIDDVPIWQQLASKGQLTGYLLEGRGFDVGNPAGYNQCKQYMKKKI